jgi:hypothetical protein
MTTFDRVSDGGTIEADYINDLQEGIENLDSVDAGYASTIARTIQARFTNWVDVADWGIVPDDTTDNATALASAITDIKALGTTSFTGWKLYFQQPGTYVTSAPIVLPRTGTTPSTVVEVVGSGIRTCRVKGSGAFPTNRGIFEWEAATSRAWHQKISNLTISLPFVVGTKAIWHKANGTPGTAEWLQLDLENILIEGSNTYHEVFIDLEVGCRLSKWENVFGDPSQGANPQYDTLLLRLPDGTSSDLGADTIGMGYCKLINLHPMVRRGGYTNTLSGRFYETSIDNVFCNGGRSGNEGYGFRFTNSTRVTMVNVSNEGQGELGQFYFENCHHNTIDGFGLGTPDATDASWAGTTVYASGARVVSPSLKGSGSATTLSYFTAANGGTSGASEPTWPATNTGGTVVDGGISWVESGSALGHGIILVNSSDNEFVNRYTPANSPVFSNRMVDAIVLDADSNRNEFRRISLRTTVDGDPSNEITNAGTANTLSGVAVLNSTTKTAYSITD